MACWPGFTILYNLSEIHSNGAELAEHIVTVSCRQVTVAWSQAFYPATPGDQWDMEESQTKCPLSNSWFAPPGFLPQWRSSRLLTFFRSLAHLLLFADSGCTAVLEMNWIGLIDSLSPGFGLMVLRSGLVASLLDTQIAPFLSSRECAIYLFKKFPNLRKKAQFSLFSLSSQ